MMISHACNVLAGSCHNDSQCSSSTLRAEYPFPSAFHLLRNALFLKLCSPPYSPLFPTCTLISLPLITLHRSCSFLPPSQCPLPHILLSPTLTALSHSHSDLPPTHHFPPLLLISASLTMPSPSSLLSPTRTLISVSLITLHRSYSFMPFPSSACDQGLLS
jgi:hypothetical protein